MDVLIPVIAAVDDIMHLFQSDLHGGQRNPGLASLVRSSVHIGLAVLGPIMGQW